MSTERHLIEDKQKWGDGAWVSEPDEVLFHHKSLECKILRNSTMGNLLGYVGVDTNNKCYGFSYGHEMLHDISVHGGLSYSKFSPFFGEKNKIAWWFGFDCAHGQDLVPYMLKIGIHFPVGTYKDVNYVEKEIKSLAEQLCKFEKFPKVIKNDIKKRNRFSMLEV